MVELTVPTKQLHLDRLKNELIAAGVPDFPGDLKPTYAGQNQLIFQLPDGTDPDTATRVISDHIDNRTPEQVLADNAKRIRRKRTPEAVARLVGDRMTYEAIVETRAALNRLIDTLVSAGIPVPIDPLINRSFAEVEAAGNQLTDLLVQDLDDPNLGIETL